MSEANSDGHATCPICETEYSKLDDPEEHRRVSMSQNKGLEALTTLVSTINAHRRRYRVRGWHLRV